MILRSLALPTRAVQGVVQGVDQAVEMTGDAPAECFSHGATGCVVAHLPKTPTRA